MFTPVDNIYLYPWPPESLSSTGTTFIDTKMIPSVLCMQEIEDLFLDYHWTHQSMETPVTLGDLPVKNAIYALELFKKETRMYVQWYFPFEHLWIEASIRSPTNVWPWIKPCPPSELLIRPGLNPNFSCVSTFEVHCTDCMTQTPVFDLVLGFLVFTNDDIHGRVFWIDHLHSDSGPLDDTGSRNHIHWGFATIVIIVPPDFFKFMSHRRDPWSLHSTKWHPHK